MSLTSIYKDIFNRAVDKLEALIWEKGVESKHNNSKVLRVPDEQAFNLDGNRYLTEITPSELIDDKGYTYNLEVLNLEQLCEVVDAISGDVDLEADAKAHVVQLSPMERNGVAQLIGYVVDKRVNNKASDLSYTELLNLKNKVLNS